MTTNLGDSREVGRRLRASREKRGVKRERLALDLSMSAENWRHYESGRNQLSVTMLPGIAGSLDITLVELLRELFDLDGAESDNSEHSDTDGDNFHTANYNYTEHRTRLGFPLPRRRVAALAR